MIYITYIIYNSFIGLPSCPPSCTAASFFLATAGRRRFCTPPFFRRWHVRHAAMTLFFFRGSPVIPINSTQKWPYYPSEPRPNISYMYNIYIYICIYIYRYIHMPHCILIITFFYDSDMPRARCAFFCAVPVLRAGVPACGVQVFVFVCFV